MVSVLVSNPRITREQGCFASAPQFRTLLESSNDHGFVLNSEHRIVATNRVVTRFVELSEPEIIGKQIGEVYGCTSLAEATAGCGTADECANCGIHQALQKAGGSPEAIFSSCQIKTEPRSGSLTRDFELRVAPLSIGEEAFTLLLLSNVGDKRRRMFYEGYFLDQLHDVTLELGALTRNFVNREDAARVDLLVNRVSTLLKDQRMLIAAERGNLSSYHEKYNVAELLADMAQLIASFPWSQDRFLVVQPVSVSECLVTDGELISRILIQMAENAFEAVEPGATVTLSYQNRNGRALFDVHNPGYIPPPIADRIFETGFTTKSGPGRGLGTYAMKVLADRYLGGTVSFTTDPEAGTRFLLQLPGRTRVGSRRKPAH